MVRMQPRAVLRLVLVGVLSAGLVASGSSVRAARAQEQPPPGGEECVDPHPCGGSFWPPGLNGPFELAAVRKIRVPVPLDHDDPAAGTIQLEGWVGLPSVPDGVRVPVALHSSPYLSTCGVEAGGAGCSGGPENAGWWSDPAEETGFPPYPDAESTWGVAPFELVKRGYAAVFFSVRGTGTSGGCWDFFGHEEQRDQAVLVQWLADQDWSNGRVGMGGISYPGTTPLEAAIHRPAALKTTVAMGVFTDLYTGSFSPQGAAFNSYVYPFWFHRGRSVSTPSPLAGGAESARRHVGVAPERVCPTVQQALTAELTGTATDQRDAAFWAERRLIDHFPEVTTSVLLVHGFEDRSLHAFQENAAWRALQQAPKRLIEGPWGHVIPTDDQATLDASWRRDTWTEILFEWLDYWLKGMGERPEHLDMVDYQDQTGDWHVDVAWPPAAARIEVLHAAGQGLMTEPAYGDRSFRSVPTPINAYEASELVLGDPSPIRPSASLCPQDALDASGLSGVAFVSEPTNEAVLLAGDPFAHLLLSSTQRGGVVGTYLFDVGPRFSCDALGQPEDVRMLAWGAADLRFHEGNMSGRDFPAHPSPVRVDLTNLAELIEPGHRLALVVNAGEMERAGQPGYRPEITIHTGDVDSSQLVLPVVEGSFGGAEPAITYPSRPFVPEG